MIVFFMTEYQFFIEDQFNLFLIDNLFI